MNTENNRIVVTGASGFIGSKLVQVLNNKKINYTPYSCRGINNENFTLPLGSTLIHLAAIAHSNCKDETLVYTVNRDLPYRLAVQAKSQGFKKIIFLSSSLVWGSEYNYIDSSIIENPDSIYGKSKLQAEQMLNTLAADDFLISIIRVPVVYGSGVKGNIYRLMRAVHRWPICPLSVSSNLRSFANLNNLVDLIIFLSKNNCPGLICYTDSEPISTKKLIYTISQHLPKHGIVFEIPEFYKKVIKGLKPMIYRKLFGSYILDFNHTKEIGFIPSSSFEDGINEMVIDYLKENI